MQIKKNIRKCVAAEKVNRKNMKKLFPFSQWAIILRYL